VRHKKVIWKLVYTIPVGNCRCFECMNYKAHGFRKLKKHTSRSCKNCYLNNNSFWELEIKAVPAFIKMDHWQAELRAITLTIYSRRCNDNYTVQRLSESLTNIITSFWIQCQALVLISELKSRWIIIVHAHMLILFL
jgi:hypothetical protein